MLQEDIPTSVSSSSDEAFEQGEISMRIAYRPAMESDLPLLEWFGAYRKYRNLYEKAYREQIEGKRLLIVADHNCFPVGQIFIQYTVGQTKYANGIDRGYLYSLRVMQPFRGLGIGSRLIEIAEGGLRRMGFTCATIAVAKENTAALRLYTRLGYQIFTEDDGRWSFRDPDGKTHHIDEPCWGLDKEL